MCIRDRNSGTSLWTQLGQDIDGEAVDDQSGGSVSISSDGTRVAIGAQYNDPTTGSNAGHVRVYEWNTPLTGQWNQVGQDIDGEAQYDYSGGSVSISSDGTRVAIGAHYNDPTGGGGVGPYTDGHVRVYEWDNGTSQWNQMGSDIDGEATSYVFGSQAGFSVSISSDGTRVAIGAVGNDGNGNAAGHVQVYEWNSVTPGWEQVGQDIDGEAAGDQSGWSVSLLSLIHI